MADFFPEVFTDPEFIHELMGANEAAGVNKREVDEMLSRHPDLPTEIVLYLVGSAQVLVRMSEVMGRVGEALITASERLVGRD